MQRPTTPCHETGTLTKIWQCYLGSLTKRRFSAPYLTTAQQVPLLRNAWLFGSRAALFLSCDTSRHLKRPEK